MAQLVFHISGDCYRLGDLVMQYLPVTLTQSNQRSALAAFGCQFTASRLRQKILERHEQVRTQTSFFAADRIEVAPLQQQREETLSKILCFFRLIAITPDESVKGPPISAAKLFQRHISCRRSTLRSYHHAPMRSSKCDRSALRARTDPSQ